MKDNKLLFIILFILGIFTIINVIQIKVLNDEITNLEHRIESMENRFPSAPKWRTGSPSIIEEKNETD